jgi:hypothetical protein
MSAAACRGESLAADEKIRRRDRDRAKVSEAEEHAVQVEYPEIRRQVVLDGDCIDDDVE